MLSSRAGLCFVPLLILWLFWPVLVGRERLAFRDVSHFYTPLYQHVAQLTDEAWLPQWNPLDQTGMPLIGETTTAVLYPPRYVSFWLPLSAETAMGWYLVLHLMLAFVAATLAARWAGVGPALAPLSGTIYALSGSVLFLYTNPPFLVGAAWLPLVLGPLLAEPEQGPASNKGSEANKGSDPNSAKHPKGRSGDWGLTPYLRAPKRAKHPQGRSGDWGLTPGRLAWSGRVMIAGPAMAMMILGGDPQSAVHAMLVVATLYLGQWLVRLRSVLTWRTVVAVPLLAAALSAPQLAASMSWSRQSDRIVGRDHQVPTDRHQGEHAALGSPDRTAAFRFSLPPWHAVELVTPNAFGSLFPIHRRLSRLIPGDGQMWTPSIYMSMAACCALGCSLLTIRRRGVDRWLVLFLITLWLSMGHFGLLWWVQFSTGAYTGYDSAIGGPYWLLYRWLPGYDAFRYPAKWLPLCGLAMALISARYANQLIPVNATSRGASPVIPPAMLSRRTVVAGGGLAGALLIGIVITKVLRSLLPRWNPAALPADEFWGPLDVAGGLGEVEHSLLHSLLALVALAGVLIWRRLAPIRTTALISVVAIELAIAGAGMIAMVPRGVEQRLIASLRCPELTPGVRLMRMQSGNGWPSSWQTTNDPLRLRDVEASQRAALFGRWHLAAQSGMLNNMVSIQSRAMAEFWELTAAASDSLSAAERDRFWARVRDWLAVDGVVHASTRTAARTSDGRVAQLVELKFNLRSSPSHSGNGDRGGSAGGRPLGARKTAAAEVRLSKSDWQPNVVLDSTAWVTRPVFQDGHWTATYAARGSDRWQPVAVQSVAGITQGVILPAGNWDLRFRYAPRWLPISLAIAAISWLSWLLVGGRMLVRRPWEWA